ncbi:MAG: 3-oxoacyl-ACP synthase [Polyangiaceae bacterium]|nr:3-oxoacyl-ACP synthase [Polyangiaceae bacterium]
MRIWVTGVGVVSPLARSASATMDRLLAGDRAFQHLTLFSLPEARSSIAAEIHDLSAAEVAPEGETEAWSRTDTMAVLAARDALTGAGVHASSLPIDLIVGGTTAGMFETEDLLAKLSNDPSAIKPLNRMISHPLTAPADHVDAALGPFRRVRTVCSACSSGASAVALGAVWLKLGRSERVLAGGADGLCRLTYSGFAALGALSPEPCRPFDRRRSGLSLGEAAAFLLLETEAAARARGAVPLAELRGWAIGSEGHHITNPERDGHTAARVMMQALARGGLTPADIDYVNAHGTATPLNDVMETAAIRRCFGARAAHIPVSTIKGQVGHTLGAAGALEAAVTVLAIHRGAVPPTGGLEEVDPECTLDHVYTARKMPVRAAVSSSFGFGGMDTVLTFAKCETFGPPPDVAQRGVVITGGATVGPLGVYTSAQSLEYLSPGPPPDGGSIAFRAADHLDLTRARRLDRAGRFGTVAIEKALAEAQFTAPSHRTGAILGASFGNVDASTAYMKRIYAKGAKYASPADFPNLLPSSPVGHASIYLGLHGPALAMSDLNVTAETAMTTAIELVAAGEADHLFAGSVEETSPMIERCLGPVCEGIVDRGPRSEGAAVALFESQSAAQERGASILASVAYWTSWRGELTPAIVADLPAAPADAIVLVGRRAASVVNVLKGTSWQRATVYTLSDRAGDHEGAGGFAVIAGAAAVAQKKAGAALIVGKAKNRGYAVLLAPPPVGGESARLL